MRREQILKLCCNHYITPELKFTPMLNTAGKALCWFAMDFAYGVPTTEQLSFRFKTAEIAEQFQKAVQDAKESISGGKGETSATPVVETIGATSDSAPAVEGFKFSMTTKAEAETPKPAFKLGGGFNFSLNMTPGIPSTTSPIKSPGMTSTKTHEISEDGSYVNKERGLPQCGLEARSWR